MKTEYLKRTRFLCICLLGAFLFFTMGCRGNMSSNESQAKAPQKSEISPRQAVSTVKDHIIAMLPYASGKKKDKLNEIIKYLNDYEKKPDNFFDDPNNWLGFMQSMIQAGNIATEMEPDNFHVNYTISDNYFTAASFIESFLDPSEENKRLSEEYKQKALQMAKALVKKFPDEAKAYHQLGFFTEIVEGDSEKALKLFRRCVEIDPELEMCQKAYDATREELEN